VRGATRGLERYYGCLLAQAALDPIALDYVLRWVDATERGEYPPDPTDLFVAAAAVRVPVLSPEPVMAYLRQCFKTGRIPDETRIVQAIAHAYAERDLMKVGATCHCPARRPLFQRPARTGFRGD
jgi:hypothetical protein